MSTIYLSPHWQIGLEAFVNVHHSSWALGLWLLWFFPSADWAQWKGAVLCWWRGACCSQNHHLDRRWSQLHLSAAEQVGSDGSGIQNIQVGNELWEVYYGKIPACCPWSNTRTKQLWHWKIYSGLGRLRPLYKTAGAEGMRLAMYNLYSWCWVFKKSLVIINPTISN